MAAWQDEDGMRPRRAEGGRRDTGRGPGGLATLCGAAVVIAGLSLAREVLVPLVLAGLFAFVLAPVARLLQRRLRVPRALSVVVTSLLAVALIVGIGLAVSGQVVQLAANLPRYQAAVRAKVESLRLGEMLAAAENLAQGVTGMTTGHGGAPAGAAAPAPAATGTGAPLDAVLGVAEQVLAPLATAGLVVVFVIFVLLYREDLRDRLIRLAGARDLHRTTVALNDAANRLSRFFLAQVALNAGFGLVIGLGLWLTGLPNPALWGALAGLMRFVPFIGSFIAVVPPLLLALAVDPGWSLALTVLALFLVTEPLAGQVFEPLLYGHSTGLSPIAIIVAATFWAFLWGPVGLLLATPLTVCLVVLGRHVERLEFLDVMLGDRPPLRPDQSFYQRALEGDADLLVTEARRHLKAEAEGEGRPLVAWCDTVALRGLALAQADWSREVLDGDQVERIRSQVEMVLDELAAQAAARPGSESLPDSWRAEGAVLCIAGQGPFDAAAAGVLALILRAEGFGARALPNAALEAAQIETVLDPARIRLCLLSVLEGGSSATSVRYFLRRLHRHLPEARMAIGLWEAASDSPMLAALRGEAAGEVIVTSAGEALALVGAAAERPAQEAAPLLP
ncbi:AI-2E family transporter [Belnapia sp. T6]|uniref:AI-2E family transporter n=1 Tax=Belnapia mucosa TaxID=2804532 RepID=A0ABS1V3Z2_9PROT|nr:AI-2E family transporter [Belnapia mucosa]MBL6456401.1 AI-2E family transporter [Belnapia mucosa]